VGSSLSQSAFEPLIIYSTDRLAGSDTTTISLRACFYYLIRTPITLKRLREELREAHKAGKISDPITLEESLKLPYL
jgi:cytochrome P450